jgi:PAS domain S-box-containing protein
MPIGNISTVSHEAAPGEAGKGTVRLASLLRMAPEDLLESLLERSPFAQYVVTSEGVIASWNEAAAALLGYRASEIIGQSPSVLMPTQFHGLWRQAKERIGREKVVSVESVRRHRDGHLIDVAVTAVFLAAADGSGMPSYLIILQDKRRQREVEAENEQLAAFVRHSPLPIVGTDTDGCIRSWNAAATALFGYTAEEALGQAIAIIMPDDRRDAGHIAPAASAEPLSEVLTERRTRDGRRVPVSINSAPLVNSSGAVIGWASFYRDRTRRLVAEQSLRESEAFARSLIEASPDWIAVLDELGAITYDNRGVADAAVPMGIAARQRVGWLDIWPATEVKGLAQALAAARRDGAAQVTAMRIVGDGRRRWYDVQVNRLPHSSTDRQLLVTARDITEKKASDDHVSLVNRELSHRAKNLLTVILAMARTTAARAASVGDFTDGLYARLYGLSRSHDLLVSRNWIGADSHSLALQHLKPFVDVSGTRFLIEGPRFLLAPAEAQCLGMAFHELATNSVKHGALSCPNGIVRLSIARDEDGYVLAWREEAGPAVAASGPGGFGTIVLEDMVTECFGRQAQLELHPMGAIWTARVPFTGVRTGDAHVAG